MVKTWRDCWREDLLVGLCSSTCKTRGSKESNMPTSFKTKTDIAKFLAWGNMIKNSILRVYTLTHKVSKDEGFSDFFCSQMDYCTLLREPPLVLILAFPGWASGSGLSGKRWISRLTCRRRTRWFRTLLPALSSAKSSSLAASTMGPSIECTP